MSNMSYCRFQNTLADLRDVERNLHNDVSLPEWRARAALIKLCKEIADQTHYANGEPKGDWNGTHEEEEE